MRGFEPTTDYFNLGEIDEIIRKLNTKKAKRIGNKNKKVKEAIKEELLFLKGDKELINIDEQNKKEDMDLRFIVDVDDDFEGQNEEFMRKIEREVYKTKDQKMDDFMNMNPSIAMRNGGNNDVYQAVM